MFTLKNKTTFLFLTLCSLILGITLIGALQASTVYEVPSAAASERFVESLITEAQGIVNDPSAGERAFGDLLTRRAVIDAIARFVLGSHGHAMTPQQFEEFCELIKMRLIRVYSTEAKLKAFRETTHEMDSPATEQPDKTMLVKTSFYFKGGGEPMRVYWKIVMKNGELFVLDILFEKISMLLTLRQEYNAIYNDLSKGGVNPVQFLSYLSDQLRAH